MQTHYRALHRVAALGHGARNELGPDQLFELDTGIAGSRQRALHASYGADASVEMQREVLRRFGCFLRAANDGARLREIVAQTVLQIRRDPMLITLARGVLFVLAPCAGGQSQALCQQLERARALPIGGSSR